MRKEYTPCQRMSYENQLTKTIDKNYIIWLLWNRAKYHLVIPILVDYYNILISKFIFRLSS